MTVQFPIITFVLFFATALAIISGISVWRYREVTGSTAFVVLMGLVAYWSLTYGIQLLFVDREAQLFWESMQYPGGVLTPVAFLVFVLYYTGRERLLTLPRLLGAVALPALTAVVVWVPELSWLVRSDAELVRTGSVTLISLSYGPLFFLVVGYSYLLITAGLLLLIRRTLQTPQFFRNQSLLITIGAVVPICGSVITYVLGMTSIDLTPVGLSVFGITVVVALTRFRLLDVVPVARDSVINEINDGILVTDAKGRIIDINPAGRRILGLEESIGVELRATDSEYVSQLLDLAAGETTELVVSGDTDRYYQCRKTALADAPRTDRVAIYILHDVTERRTREQWFRSLTEYSSDIVCVLDEQLRFRYVSPSIERILGYAPEAIEGDELLSYVHDDDAADVRETLLTEEGPATLTYRARTADDSWRTLQSRSQNRLADPVVEGIIVNVRDITEIQARKRELQETNERLDMFASVVSHDLRNPLSVAKGHTVLLEETLDEQSGATEHLEALTRALDRMDDIVEDTLTLARQGDAVLEPRQIDLAEQIRRSWQMVETADARLEIEGEPTIRGDPDQLRQVFENLLRNAVEHGGEAVTVRLGALDSDGFYLEDDGSGIPEETRGHLFETDTPMSDGEMSFGLAIVRRIADAHGWQVTVTESEEGGARFEFTGVEISPSDHSHREHAGPR